MCKVFLSCFVCVCGDFTLFFAYQVFWWNTVLALMALNVVYFGGKSKWLDYRSVCLQFHYITIHDLISLNSNALFYYK